MKFNKVTNIINKNNFDRSETGELSFLVQAFNSSAKEIEGMDGVKVHTEININDEEKILSVRTTYNGLKKIDNLAGVKRIECSSWV